ncbi:hypothetical protein [Streptomyces globisporus]|uniref:hypothetical protein n=1 Tax=Streptomyces globisporus TaxID=1908 RepID=UPI0037FAAFA3
MNDIVSSQLLQHTEEDVQRHVDNLVSQFRRLPDEAMTRLQYFAPATGCFNRCSFCSQAAGREVWQLTPLGLYSLIKAVAIVAEERGIRVSRGRDAHRPGTIFPYLDNDIASYPYLYEYLRWTDELLGCKVRISTVGYSSAGPENPFLPDTPAPNLAVMHRRIAGECGQILDGIRLSLTPYTLGWKDRTAESTTRKQFIRDMANLLATYRPVFNQLGHGAATAAVELRFAPLVGLGEVIDTNIDGRHVIAVGPHLLISTEPTTGELPIAQVMALGELNEPVFSTDPTRYLHLTSDQLTPDEVTVRAALSGSITFPHQRREVDLYKFSNADGPYYAIEPNFDEDGHFTALHIYLRTEQRSKSGYTNATRWFLNTLLDIKAGRGYTDRFAEFPDATWSDVKQVEEHLAEIARSLDNIDNLAARHIRNEILPIVETYTAAINSAGMPASTVFSPSFTLDTGQIVNQGRARTMFRGLVTVVDEPMTPREERGYGATSLSSRRGTIWRLAPMPFSNEGVLSIGVRGGKNEAATAPALVIEELDPRHLRNTDRETGTPLGRFVLYGVDMEHVDLDEGRERRAFPGIER